MIDDVWGQILVTGGQQRRGADSKEEWHKFQEACVVVVDPRAGRGTPVLRYVTPPDARPDVQPNILFKSGSLCADGLWVCTQTEVLLFSTATWEVVRRLTLSWMNDLHHVLQAEDGKLYVVATGLDMVVQLDASGRVMREWDALGGEPFLRFDRDVDYRSVPSTKPHQAHPNFLALVDGLPWVTRFKQRDAVELDGPGRTPIDVQSPHDGVLFNGRLYFTTVDGHVVVCNPRMGTRERVHRLADCHPGLEASLGWCRGLHVINEDVVVVGFSRIRPTKLRENLRWVKHAMGRRATKGALPTRVAAYDLRRQKVIWEVNVEEADCNCVFSVLPFS